MLSCVYATQLTGPNIHLCIIICILSISLVQTLHEHKSWDWKVFAMTGLTIHGANYPSNKYCFQDLVLFGIAIVHNLIHQKNIRPENIILYGDSFGGATAEYVFQHYANRTIYLASRIVSNSFTSLDKDH